MITVVTPFQRKENLDLLVNLIKGKANWTVLVDEGDTSVFPEWVTVKRYEKPREGTTKSNVLFNRFISEGLDAETQYMILCDDDAVEDGFFDKIPNKDIVVTSMKRSDRAIRHVIWADYKKGLGRWEESVDILTAHPDNMHVGAVGGEQVIIKGKILRNFRYGLSPTGDGEMIERMMDEYGGRDDLNPNAEPLIHYLPDTYVLFNYYEDGRYKSFKRPKGQRQKPVVLFVGDYFCAGRPQMGLSEWEGNIWASLESTNLAEVCRFHFDKYYYHTGERGDTALIERINEIQPDLIVLIIYKPMGSDPAVLREDTLKAIDVLGVPIVTIWGDLEAQQQRDILKTVQPYCKQIIGTANKEVVESLGHTYSHVPKDPRVFNNPNKVRDIDIVFSGSFGLGREERQKYMLYLLDNGIKLIHGGSEGRDHFTTEEYADRYKRSKLALSFSKAHGMNVVNARPFEAMSCGAMLLEQKSDELAKLYTPGVDYVEWTDEVDLLNKVRYYLEHEDERTLIASNGCKKTQELYSAKTFWTKVLS